MKSTQNFIKIGMSSDVSSKNNFWEDSLNFHPRCNERRNRRRLKDGEIKIEACIKPQQDSSNFVSGYSSDIAT